MEFLDKSRVVIGRPQESSSLVEKANPSSETSRREFPERLSDSRPAREQKGESAGGAGSDQTPESVRLSEVRDERPEKAAGGTF